MHPAASLTAGDLLAWNGAYGSVYAIRPAPRGVSVAIHHAAGTGAAFRHPLSALSGLVPGAAVSAAQLGCDEVVL